MPHSRQIHLPTTEAKKRRSSSKKRNGDDETDTSLQQPVRFLLVTQNIGSIESASCKDGVISEAVVNQTEAFVAAMRSFVLSGEGSVVVPGGEDHGDTTTHQLPDVVVIHMQEIGGKKHNRAFNDYLGKQVSRILPSISSSKGEDDGAADDGSNREGGGWWCSGLLMQDRECDSTFTAMGCVIFLSSRIVPLSSLLSVRHRTYVAIADDPGSYVGSPQFLFHGAKFSSAEKSRKGFLLTSLRIGTTCVNFVNLHLYHDADNKTAVAASPSSYSQRRLEAFLETIQEISPVINLDDPLFIFGDYNTRLDGHRLMNMMQNYLGGDTNQGNDSDDDDDKKSQPLIQMGKKEIHAPEAFWEYLQDPQNVPALQQMDTEVRWVMDATAQKCGLELGEFPVFFPMTYYYKDANTVSGGCGASPLLLDSPTTPAEEAAQQQQQRGQQQSDNHNCDAGGGGLLVPGDGNASPLKSPKTQALSRRTYARERIPAWCDRAWFNAGGYLLVAGDPQTQTAASSGSANSVVPPSGQPTTLAELTQAGGSTSSSPSTGCYRYQTQRLAAMDHNAVYLTF